MSIFKRLFGSKSPVDTHGIMAGYIDHHSHILPGVDDGCRTTDDSLACLRAYEDLGFAEVWLTPHIMEDYPNRPEDLRHKFDELNDLYKGPIKLHLAAENMMDTLFAQRLESDDLLTIGDRLLVETSYYNPPSNFHDTLDLIMHKGYRPLLAHPERYRYMDMDEYKNLRDKGVEFQLNIYSLAGMYGEEARQKSVRLLKSGFYSFSGTDIHRPAQAACFEKIASEKGLLSRISTIKN